MKSVAIVHQELPSHNYVAKTTADKVVGVPPTLGAEEARAILDDCAGQGFAACVVHSGFNGYEALLERRAVGNMRLFWLFHSSPCTYQGFHVAEYAAQAARCKAVGIPIGCVNAGLAHFWGGTWVPTPPPPPSEYVRSSNDVWSVGVEDRFELGVLVRPQAHKNFDAAFMVAQRFAAQYAVEDVRINVLTYSHLWPADAWVGVTAHAHPEPITRTRFMQVLTGQSVNLHVPLLGGYDIQPVESIAGGAPVIMSRAAGLYFPELAEPLPWARRELLESTIVQEADNVDDIYAALSNTVACYSRSEILGAQQAYLGLLRGAALTIWDRWLGRKYLRLTRTDPGVVYKK
jgi:hypothetical protein